MLDGIQRYDDPEVENQRLLDELRPVLSRIPMNLCAAAEKAGNETYFDGVPMADLVERSVFFLPSFCPRFLDEYPDSRFCPELTQANADGHVVSKKVHLLGTADKFAYPGPCYRDFCSTFVSRRTKTLCLAPN